MTTIRLLNINIKINLLFFLSLLFFLIFGYFYYTLISFVIVFLHEVSHTIVANLLGYRAEEIEIFPLGGVVKLDKLIGSNPKHEILIAIVGPLSNLVLAMISYFFIKKYFIDNYYLSYFIYANTVIAVTNLLPILPLDGGRVCRAYLSYLLGTRKATNCLVVISKIIILFLFGVGIYLSTYNKVNIIISFVAIFLYIAIRKEKEMAIFIFMQEIMEKKKILFNKGILKTKHLVAIEGTPAKKVINRFKPSIYHIVTVLDEESNVIGVVTENDMINGVMKHGLNTRLETLLIDKKRW